MKIVIDDNEPIEITEEYFNSLMNEQAKGKDLKVINGEVVAVEHIPTQKELLEKELKELLTWFEEYDKQTIQYQRCQRLGIEFDKDINELDAQAQTNSERITEIRNLLK